MGPIEVLLRLQVQLQARRWRWRWRRMRKRKRLHGVPPTAPMKKPRTRTMTPHPVPLQARRQRPPGTGWLPPPGRSLPDVPGRCGRRALRAPAFPRDRPGGHRVFCDGACPLTAPGSARSAQLHRPTPCAPIAGPPPGRIRGAAPGDLWLPGASLSLQQGLLRESLAPGPCVGSGGRERLRSMWRFGGRNAQPVTAKGGRREAWRCG